jgi:hypothetical protein
MPKSRTVLEFEFLDAPKTQRFFWLVCNRDVEVCVKHPGFDTDLRIRTKVITMAEVWRGIRPINHEIKSGRIKLFGKDDLKRGFPDWLLLSVFATH